ncbi:MAG: GNAT family N-acetyltransferase [Burkholderiales bacterium]|nr:GNAT family N-acetyltransferase [Burkholderiales bacterium]
MSTPRLRLAAPQAGDLNDIYAIFSDPVVMRYWSHAPWQSRVEAEAWLARVENGHATGDAVQWAIREMASGAVIGTITLFKINTANHRAEIGYALAQRAWGVGYMAEALRAVIDHAFGSMALHRLEADIDPRNEGSAHALGRQGFICEGILRQRWCVGGEWSDTGLYGLLATDWAARAG